MQNGATEVFELASVLQISNAGRATFEWPVCVSNQRNGGLARAWMADDVQHGCETPGSGCVALGTRRSRQGRADGMRIGDAWAGWGGAGRTSRSPRANKKRAEGLAMSTSASEAIFVHFVSLAVYCLPPPFWPPAACAGSLCATLSRAVFLLPLRLARCGRLRAAPSHWLVGAIGQIGVAGSGSRSGMCPGWPRGRPCDLDSETRLLTRPSPHPL